MVTIGNHRLACGDCLEILPTIEAGSVDAVVTSPPYNQLGERMPDSPTGIWRDKGRGFLDSVNTRGYPDDIDELEYQKQQNDLFGSMVRAVKDGGSLFYNHQLRWRDGECIHPIQWFSPSGWKLRSEIIWDRCGGMMFNARMFCRFDERIIWFCKGSHKWNQSEVGHGTVWRIARETNKEHPVAFPMEVPSRCIRAATDECDTVIDPYMGSATTGVACERLGRKFIGIEQEPKYFDIACRRIEEACKSQPLFAGMEV